MANLLYFGDNLEVLRRHVANESVDLIYLDPPWNKKKRYNILFVEQNGSRSPAQIRVFEDSWQWDTAAVTAYQEIVESGGQVSTTMQAFRQMLGDCNMLAYLSMMAPRLVELRRVLRPTGSIYLHCDSTASPYLRLLMDAVFGPKNFLNNIVWCYGLGGSSRRYWPRKHDDILWYSKVPDKHSFKPILVPAKSQMMKGQLKKAPDYWDIPTINNMARERLGYPTQKPEALLERIVQSSSREGDTVLDPFCGCGTTIAVAHRLNRRWVGIDITHLATNLIKFRLQSEFGVGVTSQYQVMGEPTDLPGARELAKEPFQFQMWALGLVGARPSDPKKGADRGIDGRLFFHDEPEKARTKQIILSVKSGGVSVKDVRDLRGVVEREKVEIGVLITLQDPTKAMRSEAATAGFYSSPWGKHPRLQILTIAELLQKRMIDYPPSRRQ
ncbi:MAG: DNA methyltransferase [Patescibacteria group bacterium]